MNPQSRPSPPVDPVLAVRIDPVGVADRVGNPNRAALNVPTVLPVLTVPSQSQSLNPIIV